MRRLILFLGKIVGRVYQHMYRKMMIGDLEDMIKHNPAINNTKIDGEEANIKKWQVLTDNVSPLAYRIYTPFIGQDVNIVPPDVSRAFVEPVLNPGDNVPFYNDKNSLNLFVSEEDTPKVYFRSIGYKLMDGSYNPVKRDDFADLFVNVEKVIVKPAKDQGGHGIAFFERKDGILKDENNISLSVEYLEKVYQTDFLIQECFVQSDYMAQFNPTSVNTIRVNTYRDVKTGEIHVLGAALRVGANGARVDNATSGGVIVGVDDNGKLGNCTYDKYGREYRVYNNINFESNTFNIPNFEEIKKFAVKISLRVPHMSLFALDIVLDKDNTPKLIEVNTHSFSVKFMQLTKGAVFGEFTDDVISYCADNKDNMRVRFRYM